MARSYASRAICSRASITPASIHSSRLWRSVVAEHDSSAIRQHAQPKTQYLRTSFSKTT
jgi:hypothetical protein